MPVVAGCPQIQPIQFPGDYYPGYVFLNSRRFLWGKPYNIKMQVKFVLSQDLQFFESELAFTRQGC